MNTRGKFQRPKKLIPGLYKWLCVEENGKAVSVRACPHIFLKLFASTGS